ncbi:unnamed protein product [Effrenium voratum]|uniref:UVR domain-containing protein n=1 Tax=Effrenium voratum TaxID=2562239 RepID=A0AA36IVD4_9DINO|nr:unnamed protein product [Effrenium voratum]CAJ1457970.1 unnamed protein product [Effrenium voratum]
MGGFNAWAKDGKGKPPRHFDQETFMVDNSELRSDARGIFYRKSMSLVDKDRKIAEFKSVVRGMVCGQWLQVGDLYLPMEVNGKRVLLQAWWSQDRDDSPVEKHLERRELQLSAAESQKAERPQPLPEPNFESPPEVRPLTRGSGTLYEVVCDRLIIRTAPHPKAPMQGTRRRGQVLELFDWDKLREMRRLMTLLGPAWVALDSANGPQLRPKGLAHGHVDPLCQAAREGCVQDLHRFISEGLDVNSGDVSPLMLAAQREGWQGLVCCVLLLEAGADPKRSTGDPEKLADLERRKRAAVEAEDFQQAAHLKEEIQRLKDAETTQRLGGTAGAQLLAALERDADVSFHEIFEEVRGMDAPCQNLPQRVHRLLEVHQPEREPLSPPTPAPPKPGPASPPPGASAVCENEESWLATPLAARRQGAVYRVAAEKAWVYEKPSTSAELLGLLRQHQLLEILDYDLPRSFGRVVVEQNGGRESGWVLLEDEFLGPLLKPFRG